MILLNYLRKILFTFYLICCLFAQSGEDDFSNLNFTNEIYNRGSSAAAFLEIGVGARATALGNAYTAVSDDPATIFWNPAGLSWVEGRQISFNHADWLADTDFENVSFVIPINTNNAIGMYFTYLNYVNNLVFMIHRATLSLWMQSSILSEHAFVQLSKTSRVWSDLSRLI